MKNELPQRLSPRWRGYDYSAIGSYFITVCTHNRQKILSTVTEEENATIQLSACGEIVEKWISRIPEKYPLVTADHYVIMPNHVHLLLSINKEREEDITPSIVSIIGWLKYAATKEINTARGASGEKIFQRSFYDHIVRTREEYCEIYKYIRDNPICWHLDQLYVP